MEWFSQITQWCSGTWWRISKTSHSSSVISMYISNHIQTSHHITSSENFVFIEKCPRMLKSDILWSLHDTLPFLDWGHLFQSHSSKFIHIVHSFCGSWNNIFICGLIVFRWTRFQTSSNTNRADCYNVFFWSYNQVVWVLFSKTTLSKSSDWSMQRNFWWISFDLSVPQLIWFVL